jgi:hypothetical protein
VDVKLTYFKQSGKYYSEGTLQVTTDKPWEIYEIVRNLLKERRLPDLIEGHSNFTVHIDIPDGVPAVIVEREPPSNLTAEQQTMLELLAYPNTEGIHPNEARWRDFARDALQIQLTPKAPTTLWNHERAGLD